MLQLLATNLRRSDKIFVSGHLLVGPQPHIVHFLSGLFVAVHVQRAAAGLADRGLRNVLQHESVRPEC
jgi:hypothetical protein